MLWNLSIPSECISSSETEAAYFAANDANEPYFVRNAFCSGRDTTYVDVCLDVSSWGVSHIVGVEAVLSSAGIPFLHHYVLDGRKNQDCSGGGQMLWAWAPGNMGMALPASAGFRVDISSGGFQALQVQVHYHNPTYAEGAFDMSGIRLYKTSTLREHDAGVLEMGDPYLTLSYNYGIADYVVEDLHDDTHPLSALREENAMQYAAERSHESFLPDESIPEGLSRWSLECSSEQTSAMLTQPITAFGRLQHMHGTGTKLLTRQYNGSISDGLGVVDGFLPVSQRRWLRRWMRDEGWFDARHLLRQTSVEYYDFNHQGETLSDSAAYGTVREWTIKPGDSFLVQCFYNSDGTRRFGLGSNDEMCIDFVYYYPRTAATSSLCDGVFGGVGVSLKQPRAFDSEESFTERLFGPSDPVRLGTPNAPYLSGFLYWALPHYVYEQVSPLPTAISRYLVFLYDEILLGLSLLLR